MHSPMAVRNAQSASCSVRDGPTSVLHWPDMRAVRLPKYQITVSRTKQACNSHTLSLSLSNCDFPAGLILASMVADLSGAPQPALLYLVPAVLTPLFAKATLQVSNTNCESLFTISYLSHCVP